MTNQQIIADLNRLYDKIREKIAVYNQVSPVAADAISEISQMLSEAIAKIERAEHAAIAATMTK